MDKRLQVTIEPRKVAAGVTAETPLVTVAWRALKAEHQRRAEEKRQAHADAQKLRGALAKIAQEAYRLECSAASTGTKGDDAGQVTAIARRILDALSAAGITVLAPEGEPYTAELRELMDNIAQKHDPAATEPRVAEVITPAVVHNGAVLKMGKAVIAVPAAHDEAQKTGKGSESS